MTNPFGAPAPAAAPAANPFGAAPAAPVTSNPFGGQPQGAAPAPAASSAPTQNWGQPQATAPTQAAPPALNPDAVVGVAPPPASGDAKGAKLPDMYGRLVVIFPHGVAQRPKRPEFITQEDRVSGNLTQETMTATVVVLDSGPGTAPGTGIIEFGGKPWGIPPTPHTDRSDLPYVRKGMWLNQSRLIAQLRDHMPNGMVVGRVTKAGPAQNDPWFLEGATPAEIETVRTYLRLVGEGRYPHPLAP